MFGADVSNAFAEAPPPVAPLYVHIDDQYREWWKSKGRSPIPKGYVLPVRGALQGHPESPRLWATLINGILINDLNLKPTTHEPCLYSRNFRGENILFLRQTDDFAIACKNESIAISLVNEIKSKMTVDIKDLGLVTRFNGVDVDQKDKYIKIHNSTFLNKILDYHGWQLDPDKIAQKGSATPMSADSKILRMLENAVPPIIKDEAVLLQRKMGFNYRQAVGELLYAMVTCRPGISFPVVKLSQYSNDPAEIHYKALRQVFQYLAQTKDHGITYWKPKIDHDLPLGPVPHLHKDSNLDTHNLPQPDSNVLQGSVDYDWGW